MHLHTNSYVSDAGMTFRLRPSKIEAGTLFHRKVEWTKKEYLLELIVDCRGTNDR